MPRRQVRPASPPGAVPRMRAVPAWLLAGTPRGTPGTAPARTGARPPGAWSGAEGVVVDVLLPLVAEERDDVLEAGIPGRELPGGGQVRARTRSHEQPELAGQAAHLADRRVAVHRDYLIDDAAVPGEDAGDEAVGDALDQ